MVPLPQTFHALSSPVRIEIIKNLADIGEIRAGEIHALFPHQSSASVSQHLTALLAARLVSVRVEATKRLYKIDFNGLYEVQGFLNHIMSKDMT